MWFGPISVLSIITGRTFSRPLAISYSIVDGSYHHAAFAPADECRLDRLAGSSAVRVAVLASAQRQTVPDAALAVVFGIRAGPSVLTSLGPEATRPAPDVSPSRLLQMIKAMVFPS